MERVVLSRIDEFIPHYLVKVLCSFAKAGFGSSELYDEIIAKVLPAILITKDQAADDSLIYDYTLASQLQNQSQHGMKYSDMIRFFEVYPNVSYIFDSTMTAELHDAFLAKLKTVIADKRMPVEDVCRVFNILVKLSPYSGFNQQETYNKILGRLRHSLHSVPQALFASTLANLLEMQQPDLGRKMALIVTSQPKFAENRMREDFPSDKEMIDLYWSLMQLSEDTKAIKVPLTALSFLNTVKVSELRPESFFRFTQLVVMTQMRLEDPTDGSSIGVDFKAIFDAILGLSADKKERIAAEHHASKTNSAIVSEVRGFLRKNLPSMFESKKVSVEVLDEPLIDDFMNVIEVMCAVRRDEETNELEQAEAQVESGDDAQGGNRSLALGVTFLNDHCFVNDLKQTKLEKGPELLKRSVELKLEILERALGYTLLVVDEREYLDLFKKGKEAKKQRQEYLK